MEENIQAEEALENIENPEENEATVFEIAMNDDVPESAPSFTMRDMLEAGIHFGHKTSRWNPKMAPYIYGVRNNLHIIDLTQTVILLNNAAKIMREVVKRNGKILFVCTKKQGADAIRELAEESGQFCVTNKWLGGMLTNWKTISQSLKRLTALEEQLANPELDLTKKEKLMLERELDKLQKNLGGIRKMHHLPDLVFIVDTQRESLAIHEARNLRIPVMAIMDTNSDPDMVDYPIPGNDDSIKAINLYVEVLGQALKQGNEMFAEKRATTREKEQARAPRKPQSTKASRSFGGKAKTGGVPALKKEAPVPAVKKEAAVPAEVKEAPVPAVTE